MTKGKLLTINQKRNFLRVLEEQNGDIYTACKICEIPTKTIMDYKKYRERDVDFYQNMTSIENTYELKLKSATKKALLENVEKGKEISVIFASKAVLGYNENGKINAIEEKRDNGNIPFEALKPATIKMIQKDVEEYNRKKEGMDLTGIATAEEVPLEDLEYGGRKLVTGSKISYNPEDNHGVKRRPFKEGGGVRTI